MPDWRKKYRTVRLLGEGGQARVFEVQDGTGGQRRALKQSTDPTSAEARARAAREIEAQSRLTHPNVMPLLDHSAGDGWLVMPLAQQYLKQIGEVDESGLGRGIADLSDADKRSDYYSLGRLVAAARSARPLMQGVASIPDGVWRRFVRETTQADRGLRPKNAEALQQLIAEAAAVTKEEASPDPATAAIVKLMKDPTDLAQARVLVTETPGSPTAETLLLDEVPNLPPDAFTSICRAGSDEELRVFANAWARQRWGERNFDDANVVLRAFLRLLEACVAQRRFGALEDVGEVYVEYCRGWDRYRHRDVSRAWLAGLPTPREAQVLEAMQQGLSTSGIATLLGISPHTVCSLVKSLRHRFRAANRIALVALAADLNTRSHPT